MTTLLIFTGLVIIGLIIMLRQVLKSRDEVDLRVSIKKGEMSVKKTGKRKEG
jgi:hypothetical protein